MNIGQRISIVRKSTKLTITALAEKTDLSREYLSQVEHGKYNPPVETIEKICNALGITLSEFFSSNEDTLSPELKQLLDNAKSLTPEQLKLINDVIKNMK